LGFISFIALLLLVGEAKKLTRRWQLHLLEGSTHQQMQNTSLTEDISSQLGCCSIYSGAWRKAKIFEKYGGPSRPEVDMTVQIEDCESRPPG